jgi:hypothetical protein
MNSPARRKGRRQGHDSSISATGPGNDIDFACAAMTFTL